MEIKIFEFAAGARQAKGITVIIDVFRAFSVACYAFESGASRVVASAGAAEAFELRKKYKASVLAGERNEKKIEGFDFGNSPTEIIREDLSGKTFIFTTTAGTNGLMNATGADLLLTGSLVNAGAVAEFIRRRNPVDVSLVAMGYRGLQSSDEDLLCASIISDRLNGIETSYDSRIHLLKDGAGKDRKSTRLNSSHRL